MWSFTDNTVIDSLESIPNSDANFRTFYVADGDTGKFKISDDPITAEAVKTITGQQKVIGTLRGETTALKNKAIDLSSLSDFGSTVDEINDGFKAKLAEAAKKGGKDKVNLQEALDTQAKEIRETTGKKHAVELGEKDKANESLRTQLHDVLVTSELVKHLNKANSIDPEMALPHLMKRIKVEEVDGKLTPKVWKADGSTLAYNAEAQELSLEEFVGEFAADERYGQLFKSETKSGGGAEPTRHQRAAAPKEERHGVQKIQAGLPALMGK